MSNDETQGHESVPTTEAEIFDYVQQLEKKIDDQEEQIDELETENGQLRDRLDDQEEQIDEHEEHREKLVEKMVPLAAVEIVLREAGLSGSQVSELTEAMQQIYLQGLEDEAESDGGEDHV